MKRIYFLPLFFVLFLFRSNFSAAQGWEKKYPFMLRIYEISNTRDSGFVGLGERYDNNGMNRSIFFKVNVHGDTIFKNELKENGRNLKSLIVDKDDNLVMTGYEIQSGQRYKILLVKASQSGNIIWSKTFESVSDWMGGKLIQTPDSGYVIINNYYPSQPQLLKTDKNGSYVWEKTFVNRAPFDVKVDRNGGLILIADGTNGSNYLIRTDSEGNFISENQLIDGDFGYNQTIQQTSDGGFVFPNNYSGPQVVKCDSLGNVEWTKDFSFDPLHWLTIYAVVPTSDNGYILTGSTLGRDSINGDSTQSLTVYKLDIKGDTVWTRFFNNSKSWSEAGLNIVEALDLGYVISGISQGEGLLLKLDINGNIYVNTISGKLYYDLDGDCIQNSGEEPLINWLVKLEPGNRYALTDSSGNYSFKVNQGTFTITPVKKNDLWMTDCGAGINQVTFNTLFQNSAANDFPFKAAVVCPLLSVDVATPFFRRCFTNTYTVSYSNFGTASQDNVQIKISFPQAVIPISSTKPYSQDGDIYTFEVGTLNAGESGKFYITDSIDCKIPLGTTHCVKALIHPATFCEVPDPAWDKSSIIVNGQCLSDGLVRFDIENTGESGEGDMAGPVNFRIYFNNVLDSTGTLQLSGKEVMTMDVSSRGTTVRLEVDQRPGHPGRSRPRASVEGCGTSEFGFMNIVPEDDEDEFVEIDCQEVMGSFDPNDKSVKPEGITEHHYIPTGAELEYRIRFQNTGTDTAFTVVIRDAISNNLDLTSLKVISASHPYEYKVLTGNTNLVEWRFRNILLPDSNVNEPQSHGYVKYKIKQKEGLPEKSVIENTADIYFDYNEAVITNTTRSVVFDTVIAGPFVTGNRYKVKETTILLHPNPFTEYAVFKLSGYAGSYDIAIFDMKGIQVKNIPGITNAETEIKRENLQEGIYIYKVFSGRELLNSGKMIIIK